ncbi:MAG: hypothetical protein WC900_03750 [Oscillospiraceae bacterium]
MLKGINRRIIEINKTENEYFEKVILFVRPEKLDYSHQQLSAQAENYLNSLSKPKPLKKLIAKNIYPIIFSLLIIALAVLAAAVFVGT